MTVTRNYGLAMLDMRPARFRHWTVAAFGGWNLLMWAQRAVNVLRDDSLTGGSKGAWMIPVVVFALGGALCVFAYFRGREAFALPIKLLAGAAGLYWLVRAVQVVIGDRSAGFKAVHTVLALVTIALAALLLRRQREVEMVPKGALL